MPVFNSERFIGEAVESVLASSLADLELLVLDDGSTDTSAITATSAAKGDGRFRLISLPHRGLAATRNSALQEARGEFIANLDADDVMFPERLAAQVAYLDRHPECVAVGTRALVVDAKGQPISIGVRHFTHEEIDGANLSGGAAAMWNPTVTFRRRDALEIGGYSVHLDRTGEDHDLWLRLGERGQLANLPMVLNLYRVHGNNVSLDDGDRERRLQARLATLARAFARRGITDRQPAATKTPPPTRSERWRDRALLEHYRGKRSSAIIFAVAAGVLAPGAEATRYAVRTILGDLQPTYR
jgi:glycosyltransferase involved in cell wall biosynthesis